MSAQTPTDYWSVQQLTELLADLLVHDGVTRALEAAVERVAEALDAELTAIVRGEQVVASFGFPPGELPTAALHRLALTHATRVALPGIGTCSVATADLDDADDRLVLIAARLGEEAWSGSDLALLVGMARMITLATRTIRTLAVERTAREGGEQLLAIQRAIIRRAPLQQVLDEITEHARAHLGGRTAVLTLRDDEGLDGHVVSVQGGPDPEAVAALRALPPDELPPGLSGRALTAVLRSDRAVVGRLTVLDAPRAELTSTQAQLFEEFAQHAALAIIGAQTLERLQQARLDPLTGLVNRAGFMDALRTAIWRAGTEGLRVSLLFVDLDRFKDINDTLGHAAGDVVLTTVATRLQRVVRGDDLVARLGGDEFAVVITGRDADAAKAIADRILEAVTEPIDTPAKRLSVTCSIGLATRAGDEDADELLRNADLAMYRSKVSRSGAVTVFRPEHQAVFLERLEMEAALRTAVAHGAFEVHYQPQVRLADGRIVGLEAFVRWPHPRRGLLPAAEFIHLADEQSLLVPLGGLVLRTACAQLQAWRATHPAARDLALGVNVSAQELHHPGFVTLVADTLAATGLPPGQLVLEVKETAVMGDVATATATLEALRATGVGLAVDGFGSGQSSLASLHRLSVGRLKLGRELVADIATDDRAAVVGSRIVDLAEALGMDVVAAGIERPDQTARLAELGCAVGQGHVFALPAPATATAELLAGPHLGTSGDAVRDR